MTTAAEALQRWREGHGRSAEAGAKVFWVALGPLRVPVPHPGQLDLHDLHHVITGYRPDLIGEIEISAFELRTGVKTPMVFFLCLAGVALGLLIAPSRTWRAWKRGAGRRNLYGQRWSELKTWRYSALETFVLGGPRDG